MYIHTHPSTYLLIYLWYLWHKQTDTLPRCRRTRLERGQWVVSQSTGRFVRDIILFASFA